MNELLEEMYQEQMEMEYQIEMDYQAMINENIEDERNYKYNAWIAQEQAQYQAQFQNFIRLYK